MNFQTLNLLFRFSKEFSHGKIRMQELSDTECMLCSYIDSHADCSQDDAASALRIDKTTVGKALTSLEGKGCVQRTQDLSDRRKNRLRLTETGYEKISDLMDLHDNWLREILTCLSVKEQKQFENYCERLLTAAQELAQKQNHGGNLK